MKPIETGHPALLRRAVPALLLPLLLVAACRSDRAGEPAAELAVEDAWSRPTALLPASPAVSPPAPSTDTREDADSAASTSMPRSTEDRGRPMRGTDGHGAHAAASGSAPAAVYLVVRGGAEADRLLGARTDVAGTVEIHRSAMEDGVMRMRRVEGGAEVPAGGALRLEPGGTHLMLLDPVRPLRAGERFPLTLRLERAGEREVEVTVREP